MVGIKSKDYLSCYRSRGGVLAWHEKMADIHVCACRNSEPKYINRHATSNTVIKANGASLSSTRNNKHDAL